MKLDIAMPRARAVSVGLIVAGGLVLAAGEPPRATALAASPAARAAGPAAARHPAASAASARASAARVLGSAAWARPCPFANAHASNTPLRLLRRAADCLVNRDRAYFGLPPLRESGRLDRAAQYWSGAMVGLGQLTHGGDFTTRFDRVGFNWQAAGENIASGFRSPRQVVDGWISSTGHCHNLLEPDFAWIGTGVVARPTGGAIGGSTWTQDLGLTMGARAPSQNWGPDSRCPY